MSIQRTCLFIALGVSALAVQAGNRSVETPVRVVAGNTTALTAIFTGDFTADNKADVLVAEQGKVRVVPGNGNGTFRDSIATAIGDARPEGIADFNGDGRPDLYLVPAGGGAAVMNGNADGTFGTIRTVSGSHLPGQLVAGDFTGDGLLDLAGVNDTLNLLVVFAGDGAGNFPASTEAALPINELADVTAGDFDRDLKLDLLATGNRNATFAWNTGTSFTTTAAETNVGGLAVVAADINGDGTTDAAAYGPELASVWLGNAARTMTAERTRIAASSRDPQIGIAHAQLDGDGRADVIIAAAAGTLTVISHDGTNFRAPRSFVAGNSGYVRVATGDFTGEGVTDVVHVAAPPANSANTLDGFFSLLRGRGDRTFRTPVALDIHAAVAPYAFDTSTRNWVADVTGDGRQDVVADVSGLGRVLAVLPGREDGTFGAAVFTTIPDDHAHGSASHGTDLNGDGRADVVRITHDGGDGDNRMEVHFGQSDGTFAAGPVATAPHQGQGVSLRPVLDYTGDGKVDLFDNAGRLFPGTGNGAFGTPIATGIERRPPEVIGNLNGDTLPDLVIFGNPAIHINNGGGAFTSVPNPIFGSIHALADLNGDGNGDALSTFIQLGNGDGTFTSRNFAIDLDLHTQVFDVDGDGHADAVTSQAIYFGTGDGGFDHAAQTAGPASAPILSSAAYDGNGSPDIWTGHTGFLTIIPTRTGTEGTTPTQLSVAATPDPSEKQQAVSIVTTVGTDTRIIPRGAVLYRDGTNPPYGIWKVGANGTVNLARISFPIGSTDIRVAFTGDEHHAPATAATSHTTVKATTVLTVTANSVTVETGARVILSGTLRGRWGGSPTGTVTYRKGSTVLTTLPVPGSLSWGGFGLTLFPIGTHTITAEYSGDADYLPSQSAPVTITVVKGTPEITLLLPRAPIHSGMHTITARFTRHPGTIGTVAFSCFGQSLGTAAVIDGEAKLTAMLPAGAGTCVASYSGGEQFNPSTRSVNVTIDVAPPAPPRRRSVRHP